MIVPLLRTSLRKVNWILGKRLPPMFLYY